MGALVDLAKVLFDPVPVFERVREKPRFLVPWLALSVLTVVLSVILRPFYVAGIAAMIAQAPAEQAAQMPSAETQATIIIASLPVYFILMLLVGTLLLWVGSAVAGLEGKFALLLSVLTYSFATYSVYAIVGAAVLFTRGVGSIQSMVDLRPPLGLDLLVPGAGPFLGGFLNGINPFSIWGVWLAGSGIAITHRTTKATGYVVAGIAYLIGLLIFALISSLGQGGR